MKDCNYCLNEFDDDEIIHVTDSRYYPDGRGVCICERCCLKRLGI